MCVCDAGTPVAVKVLVCQILSAEVVDEFRGEITVLSALRHPNVVLFMGAVTVAPNFCIITELVSRGSLWSVLHSSTPCVTLQMQTTI
jgi:serine/threonine protein kinase